MDKTVYYRWGCVCGISYTTKTKDEPERGCLYCDCIEPKIYIGYRIGNELFDGEYKESTDA